MGRYADARAEYLAGLEGRRQSYQAAPLLWSLAASHVFDRHFDDAHTALQGWADLVVKRRGYDPNDSLAFFDLAMAGTHSTKPSACSTSITGRSRSRLR